MKKKLDELQKFLFTIEREKIKKRIEQRRAKEQARQAFVQ